MDRTENVVLTNMCMIYDGSKVLVEEKIGTDIWTGTWSEVRVYELGFINNIAMPTVNFCCLWAVFICNIRNIINLKA